MIDCPERSVGGSVADTAIDAALSTATVIFQRRGQGIAFFLRARRERD
jgi:hypothetical protein